MNDLVRIGSVFALNVLVLGLRPGSAQPGPQDSPAVSRDVAPSRVPDMEDVVRLWDIDSREIARFYDIGWSEVRLERLARNADLWRGRLAEIEFDALSAQGRIDYVLLRNAIESGAAARALEARRLTEMDAILPGRREIQTLELTRRRLEPCDSRACAAIVASIPERLTKVRERIERGTKDPGAAGPGPGGEGPIVVAPVVANRAAGVVRELRDTLREWFAYHDGYQPEFSWWLRQPYRDADAALDEYGKFLRESVAGQRKRDDDAMLGDPIGRDALLADLRAEVIPYSPDELIAIAETEFAWCEKEMRRASAEMGLGDDWRAALERVKGASVEPGGQTALIASLAREAIAFLRERDLVTVPPLNEELWRLEMISPENQKLWPFAYYGGLHIGVAYPTDAMKHQDKLMSMRGNNRHFTRIVTPHELIPGHHLQGYMAQRWRPYRQVFGTPFLVEGWALHWEMLLWDMGWGRGPEDRIGMLFWRMHRGARIIVSLKFHLGQMKPAEMIDFLITRVGMEKFGAESEVRRYIGGQYSPLYQCAYMIGGLQLRALRAEVLATGRMTDRQFHDAVLTYGPIPIELIRAGITDRPVPRDGTSSWRFAGDPTPVK
ncbi:MAG: DUF885 domain-containing protein [Phycisphaerae bacterium]|nr:DUF885 domain-containing protein [Phycisphaerae bacterium]